MHIRPIATAGLLAATGFLVIGAASPAFAVCDSYSGECVEEPTGGGGGTVIDGAGGGGGTAVDRPATLPLTGGELVLLSTVGIGALVGGTALVVAGRRKAAPAL